MSSICFSGSYEGKFQNIIGCFDPKIAYNFINNGIMKYKIKSLSQPGA
jgi:hypothetical protein